MCVEYPVTLEYRRGKTNVEGVGRVNTGGQTQDGEGSTWAGGGQPAGRREGSWRYVRCHLDPWSWVSPKQGLVAGLVDLRWGW